MNFSSCLLLLTHLMNSSSLVSLTIHLDNLSDHATSQFLSLLSLFNLISQVIQNHIRPGNLPWLFACTIGLSVCYQLLSVWSLPDMRTKLLHLSCYYHTRELRCIRPYLDFKTASTIATSILHSKLDYCNFLYHNLPNCQLNRLFNIFKTHLLALLKAPKLSCQWCHSHSQISPLG